ncbi:DNA-3-methyladenine glycosylase [Silvanigrella aquatica]|uniref:Putative 3-methyladenine DNA glycosylase n=1 Tax=Silvanigrella aquatica TaxID=1915309 RepID=A0A1L4D2X9_9BACT|nr:DNA-3-methyladenine glycosylase [Silvanigrella aquatica]APJ04556.1 hypothetical protein AXG55_11825 [Silvanigrella aquatica]
MTFISKDFYLQDAIHVAPQLLGIKINRELKNGKVISGIIVETEAYMPDDPACHASRGVTKRNAPMFEEGGICYVYLIYGIYYCLNVVTGKKGSGQAVLIRALELPSHETNRRAAAGPGKLCRHLAINKEQNGLEFSKLNQIWIEEGIPILPADIQTSSRIGISKGIEMQWRFYIKNNSFVSKQYDTNNTKEIK